MNTKSKILSFIQRETILVIATILAVISCFFTPPSKEYINYIDFHTLSMLFLLMLVVAGYKEIGVFYNIGKSILHLVNYRRELILILTALCFFSSMFITNDVALITFVPLAIMIIGMSKLENTVCITVTLMTIAANLGSMLTPLGNPQNLYLFNKSKYSITTFIKIMLPYSIASAAILVLTILFVCRKKTAIKKAEFEVRNIDKKKLAIYSILFALCILTVVHVLDIRILFAIEAVTMLITDRRIFAKVDYSLLFTFTAFFIFIGNMGACKPFHDFLNNIINGHELFTSIASSQLISNVPAALLLSGFTSKWKALIIGTNLGGLGTLIASMASLISYKQIAKNHSHLRVKYILTFTLWNVVFLILLVGLNHILSIL